MRSQGSGKLVHIGSRAGYEGEPGVSMYSASKFAVAGISEALSAEMAPFGVQSMVVEPGVFRTDFLDRTSLSLPENRIAAYDGTPAHPGLGGRRQPLPIRRPGQGRGVDLRGHLPGQAAHAPLPLGQDAIERLQVKITQLQDDLAVWREKSAAIAHVG
jgi:NAD(P)-dependent dehydrogenase (short-subunit alcohol dehydrogenase family)